MSDESDLSRSERARMVEYLESRAVALTPAQIRARIRAAGAELESTLAGVTEAEARRRPVAGGWNIAEVVDHVAQTTIRGADELRHLLSGRRPPGPPVYDALVSGAAAWAPWEELLEGLSSANDAFDAALATAGADGAREARAGQGPASSQPTVRAILVAPRTLSDGRVVSDVFSAELGWKAYALVQRLHLLDHRNQIRALRDAP